MSCSPLKQCLGEWLNHCKVCMIGHIVLPVSHHHVCNIDGISNYYGLDNCFVHGCDPEIISTMATTTSALIVAIIIIIIIVLVALILSGGAVAMFHRV